MRTIGDSDEYGSDPGNFEWQGHRQTRVGSEVQNREGFPCRHNVSCDGSDAGVRGAERVLSKEEPLLDGQASEFSCTQEDAGEHGAVQAAGVGISQGWVVGGQ